MTASPAESPTPVSEPYEPFIPETRIEGSRIILPVTFPDGSTAELAYPDSLDIAGMGARPYIAGCGHDFGSSITTSRMGPSTKASHWRPIREPIVRACHCGMAARALGSRIG